MSKQLEATELWCSITNALIKKYKTLSENLPSTAVEELVCLKKLLLEQGFLTENLFEEG